MLFHSDKFASRCSESSNCLDATNHALGVSDANQDGKGQAQASAELTSISKLCSYPYPEIGYVSV